MRLSQSLLVTKREEKICGKEIESHCGGIQPGSTVREKASSKRVYGGKHKFVPFFFQFIHLRKDFVTFYRTVKKSKNKSFLLFEAISKLFKTRLVVFFVFFMTFFLQQP